STNANYSTNGRYDPAKSSDKGDIVTMSGLSDSMKVGNADVKGKVGTAPGGTVDVGSNGTVGDKAWVDGGKKGIQPGHLSDDVNLDLPDVEFPTGVPVLSAIKANWLIGGTNYNYALIGSVTGDPVYYQSSKLTGKVYATGNVAILVTDTFS